MSETTNVNPANIGAVKALCTTFADSADGDARTARKALMVYEALQVASLSIIATAIADRFARRGITAGVPSKATLSNYAKAWEYAQSTAVTDDVTVARLFTTISASAVTASELKSTIASIATMPKGERSDALNAIPTARSARKRTEGAGKGERKGEGDDATTDAAGSEAVTVTAVAQGLGLLAARIRQGELTKAETKTLVTAWRKVADALGSLESVTEVADALASVA